MSVAGQTITVEPDVSWLPIDGGTEAEVTAVRELVDGLIGKVQVTDEHGTSALTGSDILVVAPHNAHVNRLDAELGQLGVRVGTVDKFQGQQAHVVVYSMGRLAVTAGDDFVDLDSRVLFVRRIRVVGQSRPLQKFALADMDQQGTEWEDETGEVMGWIPDMETGKMRLYRKPEEDIALRLTVVRLPLVAMSANSDTPEIKPQYHRALIHWMRYRYYSLQDAEIRDEKKAREALAEFEAQFGPASNALDEAWIHEKHGFDEYEGLR